jgi:BlaI family penicillinase repressor
MRIMRVLWARGRATAREVTDVLNAEGRGEIAHSTVQTLLRQLEAKGALRHEAEGRTWVFVPIVREDEAAATATRDLLSRVFNNSVSGLVAHLLEHEEISASEMERLKQMIERAESSEDDSQEARHD